MERDVPRPEFVEALDVALGNHRSSQRFVVLPQDGAPHAYELDGARTRHIAKLEWERRRGRSGNTVPDGRAWSVRAFASVSGPRAVVLESHRSGRGAIVHGFDLRNGAHIGEVPTPTAARAKAVQLIGDFLFAAGDGMGYHWFGEEVRWHPIDLPDQIRKMSKTVDFLEMSRDTIWAIDDQVTPLYGAAYRLGGRAVASLQHVHEIKGGVNAHVVDFAANDHFLTTLVKTEGD